MLLNSPRLNRYLRNSGIPTTMTELSLSEGKSQTVRYISTAVFVSVLLITLIFNGLAGPGADPFRQSAGEVSRQNHICITPATFTFGIWGVIYFFLVVIAIYAIAILLRRVGFDKSWQLGGAVSVPFLLTLSLNLALNVGWLFAWDAENLIASAVLMFLIAITNTAADILAAISFERAASRLYSVSKVDFWMSFLVLNGQCIYNTWTTIAALFNLGIMIVGVSKESDRPPGLIQNDVCIGILSFLLVAFMIYFVLEQSLLKRIANPFITHYIVYVWAMIGVLTENRNNATPTVTNLTIANLSMGVIFFVLRVVALVLRNRRNPLYAPI